MEFKKLREQKVGAATEKVVQVKKQNGNRITLNDVKNTRTKFITDGENQFGKNKFAINHIKVNSGGKWVTFTNEQKFNDYFDSKVKDPTKFYEFNEVQYFIIFE